MKLTDTQTAALTAAAAHPDGAILPLPAHIRGGAIGKVCDALVTKGLAISIGLPGEQTLVISNDGRLALGLEITPPASAEIKPTQGRAGTKQAQLVTLLGRYASVRRQRGSVFRARTVPSPRRCCRTWQRGQLAGLSRRLSSLACVVGTWRASKAKVSDGMSEDQVRQSLQDLDPLWDELFPAEQARIVQLLVERIDVGEQGFDLRLRVDGLAALAQDLSGSATDTRKAA